MSLFSWFSDLYNVEVAMSKSIAGLATKQDLEKTEKNIMSAVTDWAAQEGVQLDGITAELTRIVAGVKALDDAISAFQNSPGTLSPSDQAALDAIQAKSKDVVSAAQAVNTDAPCPRSRGITRRPCGSGAPLFMPKPTKVLALFAVLLLTGCVGISYDVQQVTAMGTNHIHLSANRFFWSSESYVASINTNGTGSLQASKSSVDSVALGAVAQGVAQGLASGAK